VREEGNGLRDEMTEPTCTITLYDAAVMARFWTSKVFSLIQAETIGWKYGSNIRSISIPKALLNPHPGRTYIQIS